MAQDEVKISNTNKKIGLIFLFASLALLNLIFTVNHEYWRDETQAWLIARDCFISADSLFTVTSYEGHPFVWFLILMPFAKLGLSVSIMKFLSYGIVMLSLYILFFIVELPFSLKVLMALTPAYIYFFVVPSRSYCVSSLLIICIAATYKNHIDHPLRYSLLLSMLLQTLVIMGGFVTVAGIIWFFEVLISIRHIEKKTLIKNIAGLVFLLINAFFLIWEFRFTPVNVRNISPSAFILKLGIQYVSGFRLLFGSFNGLAITIISVSFIGLFIFNKHARVPVLLTMSGLIWQMYIYAFVYSNANHRVITWLYLIFFIAIAGFDIKSRSLLSDNSFIYIIIVCVFLFSWNYKCRDQIFLDLDQNTRFSYSKDVANVIDSLPEDAIVLSLSDDMDSPVVAQVDNNRMIYNIFTGKRATFADRAPKSHSTMSVKEFNGRLKKMFPDSDNIYAIVSTENCTIEGFIENIKNTTDNISIVYESPHDYVMEDYYLVLIKNH